MDSWMEYLFVGRDRRLRNGWWVLAFIGCIALTRVAYHPVTATMKAVGLGGHWLDPAPFVFIMLATWACLRLRRQGFSDLGFRLDRHWLGEFAAGVGLSLLAMLAIAGLMWAAGGVRFRIDPAANVLQLGTALYAFLCVALFEEVLFRGFAFQRLVDGLGVWPAQALLALLFALGHYGNPGMHGATEAWATIDLMLGAILFGLAYVRTGSLALPIGLHLGWNWTQGALLGFGVSGFDQVGWLQPLFLGKPEWLTGGQFGPESSVCAVLVDVVSVALIWRWKGTAAAYRRNAPSAGVLRPAMDAA